jgi:hypothetical protein
MAGGPAWKQEESGAGRLPVTSPLVAALAAKGPVETERRVDTLGEEVDSLRRGRGAGFARDRQC